MKKIPICNIYITAFFLIIITGCGNFQSSAAGNGRAASGSQPHVSMNQLTFRNIPDVTEDEIRAIEELQGRIDSFVYGMNPSTEAFEEFGEIRGFSALLCEWLTDLFEIRFEPVLYEWGELIS